MLKFEKSRRALMMTCVALWLPANSYFKVLNVRKEKIISLRLCDFLHFFYFDMFMIVIYLTY